MATPAEIFPNVPDECDVEAHVGNQPHTYQQDGEDILMPDPGNLPIMLNAYMLNRFEHESHNQFVQDYQKFLREYKIGQAITGAVDIVYENDRENIIDPALMAEARDSIGIRITHAIAIEEISPHLPLGIDPEVLRDSPFEDQEAA